MGTVIMQISTTCKVNKNSFSNNEEGSILILFAGFLVIILTISGFIFDTSGMAVKRLKMRSMLAIKENELQAPRNNAYDTILCSKNPGEYLSSDFDEFFRSNGFKGKVTYTYNENIPERTIDEIQYENVPVYDENGNEIIFDGYGNEINRADTYWSNNKLYPKYDLNADNSYRYKRKTVKGTYRECVFKVVMEQEYKPSFFKLFKVESIPVKADFEFNFYTRHYYTGAFGYDFLYSPEAAGYGTDYQNYTKVVNY